MHRDIPIFGRREASAMTGSKVQKRAWPIVRLVMIVCLTLASIIPYMAGTFSVGASSTPFAFRDDFNYSSISDTIAAGWTECGGGPASSYSVGNGILSLKDDADAVCWDNVPQGVSDWTVTWRAAWSEFSGSWVGTIRMTVGTSQHSYTYAADGYWGYFSLVRDGALVFHNGWYSADLNVFHTMRLDMVSGKITMYFDGAAMGSYTEPDPATSLVELSPTAAGYSHVNFDYVTASSLPASTTPDFSLSGNPSHLILAHGSSVTGNLTLNSINGFSGTVTLQTLTGTSGLTASVSPSTVLLSSTARATFSVTASSTAMGGRYNVTISGTSGQASHSFKVFLFIESNPYVFRDDFNYVSMKEMLAGGWTTSGGFPSSYTVGNGLLVLSQNSNVENTAAVWSAISTRVSDWSVTLRGERIGGSSTGYGDEIRLIAVTATHRYMWTGSELFRDSTLVFSTCCTGQVNTWYDLRLDMVAGTVSAYLNGNLAATYVEADPNTYLNSVGPGSSALSTDSFDYITASEPSTPYFGFGASPSPLIVISQRSGNTTILVDSRSGFTGSVSLTATGSSQGPSVSLNPTSVSLTNGGSATSVLTAVAPFATSPEEDFEITVTGTSGTVSRSMSVPVQVFQRYPHTPILIDGDGGFTSANGVRSGTGIATDPYVISDWDIDASTSTFGSGILMRHTTAHFVIRNVYVHSGLKGYDSFYGGCDPACADGIELQEVTNGIVEQNILYWNTNGVWLAGSSNITLFGNNFLQNGFPQYSDDNPTANHWDGGYPVGGNYWSDNTGAVDNCSGPSQNICPDPDGISDSNYGYDRYPLMKPFVPDPPATIGGGGGGRFYQT